MLAVAAALAVVAAGALGPQQDVSGASAGRADAVADAAVEVTGSGDVPALRGDSGEFAEAIGSYLASAGAPARTVTVVPDPSEPSGDEFYANAGGIWYGCEATEGASGWAFSLIGSRSPVAAGRAGDHSPAAPSVAGGASSGEGAAPFGDLAEPGGGPGAWVPVSDAEALAGAIGRDAASQLAEAIAGYAASRGLEVDLSAARVDPSSVRPEPGGVGFEVESGPSALDVVFSDGEYGFKVI